MIRRTIVWFALGALVLVFMAFEVFAAHAKAAPSIIRRVYSDATNNVHVVTGQDGKEFVVPRDVGQVGIDSVRITTDASIAGWLVLYNDPDGGSTYPGKLVLWRDGRVIRAIPTTQVFWSWSLSKNGRYVAFHVGPTHGTATHFELRDVATGRLLKVWEGDLESPNRPSWANGLNH